MKTERDAMEMEDIFEAITNIDVKKLYEDQAIMLYYELEELKRKIMKELKERK